MTFYLGVDAGGTFTRFVVFNENGEEVKRIVTESIHFMKVGYEGIQAKFEEVKQKLELEGFDTNSIKVAVGTAGYGNDLAIRKGIEDAIWSVFPGAYITNDARFAMISALNNEDGVYVISGTGSIAFREYEGNQDRRGGFGYLLGDEGSAYWIGKKCLEVFTKEADNRYLRSDFYIKVMNTFNLKSPYDLIGIANSQKDDIRTWTAGFSKIASECIENPYFNEIFITAGKELAGLANGFVIDRPTKIAVGGGVLTHNKVVFDTFLAHLDTRYQLVNSTHPVEYAAYILLK